MYILVFLISILSKRGINTRGVLPWFTPIDQDVRKVLYLIEKRDHEASEIIFSCEKWTKYRDLFNFLANNGLDTCLKSNFLANKVPGTKI